MNYYDAVLALIPVSFLGAILPLLAVGIPMTQAVLLGGAVSVALIGHAMFIRAPVDAPFIPPTELASSEDTSHDESDMGATAD